MTNDIKETVKINKKTIIISALISFVTTLTTIVTFSVLLIIGVQSNILETPPAKPIPTGTAAEQSNVINAVDKASPAVVSIVITKNVSEPGYNPLNDLFGIPQGDSESDSYEAGGGSGFFISPDGHIVTNKHVVSDSSADYTVVTNTGKEYKARILAKDPILDIAVLKVNGSDFKYLSFADSDDIKVGQTAIAIGYALAEFQNTVSLGIVSGLSRSIVASDTSGDEVEQLDEVIQTDAAINPGNSGGPLLDIKGNVIGVNVALQDSAQSIGFSLPSNEVKSVADSVIKYGEIRRPFLGVRYIQITEALARENDLESNFGVLVSSNESGEAAVIPNSPADKAGIKENDIITEVNERKLVPGRSLASVIRSKTIGQTIKLTVIQNGTTKKINIKLEKAPESL